MAGALKNLKALNIEASDLGLFTMVLRKASANYLSFIKN